MNGTEWILTGLLLLATAAMGCLCLAMKRHRHALKKTGYTLPFGPRTLRISGWALIALTSGVAVSMWGWGIGPVMVFGCLSFGALMGLVLTSFRVGWLPLTALYAGVLGLVIIALAIITG